MCGTCGARTSSWTERISPLHPRAAGRRARALSLALRHAEVSAARRVMIAPWPGGGLRLSTPAGWSFAPSLPDAATELTRRFGPLVPVRDSADPATRATLPAAVQPDVLAVWCALVAASGLPADGTVAIAAAGLRITLAADDIHVEASPSPAVDAVLVTPRCANRLAEQVYWMIGRKSAAV